MPDVPAIGAAFWEDPPDDWYAKKFNTRHCYGNDVYGKNACYAAFAPDDLRTMPLLGDGLGEWRVYRDGNSDTPELLVHADGVRCPTPPDEECPTHILELPTEEIGGG